MYFYVMFSIRQVMKDGVVNGFLDSVSKLSSYIFTDMDSLSPTYVTIITGAIKLLCTHRKAQY